MNVRFIKPCAIVVLSAVSSLAMAKGFYLGVSGEQRSLDARTTGPSYVPAQNWTGIGVGGYVGYQWQLSKMWDVAIEGDGEYGTTGASRSVALPGAAPTAQIQYSQKTPWQVGVSVIPSYQFSKRINLFLRGGAAYSIYSKTGQNYGIDIPVNYQEWAVSWRAGLGAEFALSWHWGLRGEYDFSYQPETKIGNGYQFTGVTQSFQLGLTYYFETRKPPRNTYIPDNTPNQQLYYTGPRETSTPPAWSGVYVGGMVLASSMAVDNERTVTPLTGGVLTNQQYKNRLDLSGLGASAVVGISHQFDSDFYLALEGQYDYVNSVFNGEAIDTGDKWSLKRGPTVGVSLNPGLVVDSDNLIYTHLGLVWTGLQHTGQYRYGTNFKENVMGYRVGLGYEFALSQYITARAEYDYTFYNRLNMAYNGSAVKSTETYRPSDNQFRVGLNFRI